LPLLASAPRPAVHSQRPLAVAVIGAGIAGLCAALELRARGCEVTVLERAPTAGGKLRQVLGVDAGPTVFTLREVFEELFRSAGERLEDHLALRPLSTLARHAWRGGASLDLHADIERSAAAIREFAGDGEARGYLRFCNDSRRAYATLDRSFMRQPEPSLGGLIAHAGWRGLPNLWRLRAFDSLWKALGSYFHDPRLRQLFGRYATYCGSSPFDAPATLMLVAHVEQAGVWQIEGGMHRLAESLRALLQARAVNVRCGTPVHDIEVSGGRVTALSIGDGERVTVDAVVATCDTAALGAGLLGSAARAAAPPLPLDSRSLSAITWTGTAAINGLALLRHNVFFSDDYAAEFDSLVQQRRVPLRPTVYVCAQDRESAAPPDPGQPERLLCLINAPPVGDCHEFDAREMAQCLNAMLSTLAHCGVQLPAGAAQLAPTTPSDFHRLFPGSGGALYGPATHGWQASFRRPGVRTRIRGLYLAGGSTHPGPGLPMAALSGRHAAHCLLQEQGSTRQ